MEEEILQRDYYPLSPIIQLHQPEAGGKRKEQVQKTLDVSTRLSNFYFIPFRKEVVLFPKERNGIGNFKC
jgi:hypothetical protein